MNKIFTFLLIFLCTNLFAQNKFELGYYIDQSGNKFEGEISEMKLDNFPEEFILKNGNQQTKVVTSSVREIKYGASIFEIKKFQYDPTVRNEISNLSKERKLNFVETSNFVQLIVDGEYKLYRYLKNGISTFFYENSNKEMVTLAYKKYLISNSTIGENNDFRVQLWNNVKNSKYPSLDSYSYLKYRVDDLEDYFKQVNGITFKREKKDKVVFNFFVGYSSSFMDIDFLQNIPGESYNHVTVMPEIEYILNKNITNITSFYFNVKYRSIKANYEEVYVRENWHHTVDYQSLYFSLGVKQYFLSSEKNKFYGKLGLGYDTPIKAEITSPPASWILNPIYMDQASAGINVGLGFKLYNSFLIEIDYDYIFNTTYVNKNTSINFKVGYSF